MAVFATDTGSIDDGRNVASYSQYDDGSGTALGKFAPNPAGLYGMTDHSFEWVQDWYEENYSGGDGRNPTGPKNGIEKVLHGSGKRGGDSLVYISMTFARDHRPPAPKPEKILNSEGDVIDANQNASYGLHCVSQD